MKNNKILSLFTAIEHAYIHIYILKNSCKVVTSFNTVRCPLIPLLLAARATTSSDTNSKHLLYSRYPEPPLLGPGSSFPFVTPEFHQSSENWKQTPQAPQPHTGIIKEAPIGGPTNTRNTAVSFVQQGQSQGAVMMVYGLEGNISNTEKLFNLVCLYGNVARVSADIRP